MIVKEAQTPQKAQELEKKSDHQDQVLVWYCNLKSYFLKLV